MEWENRLPNLSLERPAARCMPLEMRQARWQQQNKSPRLLPLGIRNPSESGSLPFLATLWLEFSKPSRHTNLRLPAKSCSTRGLVARKQNKRQASSLFVAAAQRAGKICSSSFERTQERLNHGSLRTRSITWRRRRGMRASVKSSKPTLAPRAEANDRSRGVIAFPHTG